MLSVRRQRYRRSRISRKYSTNSKADEAPMGLVGKPQAGQMHRCSRASFTVTPEYGK